MADTMKAVVYYAPKDMRVEMVPIPACGADEIRVKVDACAVCGTDLKSYLVGNPRIKAPLASGHEFTGIVETVGAQVKGFTIGERIVMATSVSCGKCYYCKQGWPNLCADVAPMGFSYPGGMAEYVTIPARALQHGHVIKVPAQVKAEHAALAEPVSCTVNAMENCQLQPGATVVVVGAGPMGILNACVARGMGASKVILAEVNEARLKQAEAFGFDRLVNPSKEDLTQIVLAETGGVGADVAIVAAPAAPPQEQALSMVRKRGTVCLFASLPVGKNMLSIDSRKIHYGELRVVGTSDSTPKQVEKAVALIANNEIPAAQIATHRLPLDGILQSFELMQSGEALRVVLIP
ncbi:alcohol dehydrogenase superfamily, zinc-containing [Candidatus Moduliflexus flocculans]|uniref:Alcohol dehydrogenase superfamily, zinc-containing n=1 Tax=Candidatus Moduliflexus flocculans TaxID=1499966 RepID=A0A0S6VSK3_9BACT|nr:alcohol dehydrogenase superfamily, zinc-containing [Candidatus Moduliflexus flocculans]